MHNLNNIQVAYIRLKPSPHTQSKYSQPLELVLFHVIVPHIKYFKGFHYSQLLNNYLNNYLIFSGLTLMSSLLNE